MRWRGRVLGVATLLAAPTFGPAPAADGEASPEIPIVPGPEFTYPVSYKKVEPIYPDSLRRLGEQGEVKLRVEIRADGTVGEIAVLSSNHEEFSKAAIAAVREWHYRPAQQGGRPVAIQYTVVVKFHLIGGRYRPAGPSPPTPAECYGEGIAGPSDGFDEPPRVAKRVPVILPERLEAVGGSVVLEFEVCRDGRVRAARVLRASDPGLGEAAVTAARDWIFVPARRDGEPVAARHDAELTIEPTRK